MKFNMIVPTTLIALLPGFALADESANYKYSGDSVGRQVCRAIVRDDVEKLQQVLRFHRQTLVYGYSFNDMAGHAIAGSFKCNDLDLQAFSYSVDAHQVLGYLNKGTGYVEEQVVSTDK